MDVKPSYKYTEQNEDPRGKIKVRKLNELGKPLT